MAPASCHIPLWAAWLVTSFVTPALRENAFWSCVLARVRLRWSSYTETEWENEVIQGRPKADQRTSWNYEFKHEMTRQINLDSTRGMAIESSIGLRGKTTMAILSDLTIFQKDRQFVEDCFSSKPRISNDNIARLTTKEKWEIWTDSVN